ncbi:MAG: HDOD domain-containing protein [Leptospirales bacterium]|nr:HDOD domain-containing protein [Leptospirales bacterium]
MEAAEQSAAIKAAIDKRLADIQQLPPMPAMASRIYSMASNPDVDIKALAEEITRDPAITAAIIKLSNSAYYKPTRPIRSVQEAIVTLGLETVANIVMVAASRGLLKVNLDAYKIPATEMWDHSLLVAELSGALARMKKGSAPPDVAFTAGLLHDIGKVTLVSYFQQVYRPIAIEMERNPSATFIAIEEKYLGYNHAQLGARLLEIWKFPPDLVDAVRNVYTPEKAQVNKALCAIIHIANLVAIAGGVGVDIGGLSEKLSGQALAALKMTDSEMEALYSHLPELLEKLVDLRSI